MPEDLPSPATASSTATIGPPVVQFEDVSIAFEGKPVLQEISFSVQRGQTLVRAWPGGLRQVCAAEAGERAA